jgi:hypothetical protein
MRCDGGLTAHPFAKRDGFPLEHFDFSDNEVLNREANESEPIRFDENVNQI